MTQWRRRHYHHCTAPPPPPPPPIVMSVRKPKPKLRYACRATAKSRTDGDTRGGNTNMAPLLADAKILLALIIVACNFDLSTPNTTVPIGTTAGQQGPTGPATQGQTSVAAAVSSQPPATPQITPEPVATTAATLPASTETPANTGAYKLN